MNKKNKHKTKQDRSHHFVLLQVFVTCQHTFPNKLQKTEPIGSLFHSQFYSSGLYFIKDCEFGDCLSITSNHAREQLDVGRIGNSKILKAASILVNDTTATLQEVKLDDYYISNCIKLSSYTKYPLKV